MEKHLVAAIMTSHATPPASRSCHLPTDAWCAGRPSLRCEFELLREVIEVRGVFENRLGELRGSHAFVCPDNALLDALVESGPLVEIGAGTGYWARLIQDRGGDVVPIDKRPPQTTWVEVLYGDEQILGRYSDRSLLMVRPYDTQSPAVVKSWRGDCMWVVQHGPFPNPHNGLDERLIAVMDKGRWQLKARRPLWDPLDAGFTVNHFVR